ncbi:hypothetical protein [Vibrio aphrogenes]|uniref:hypothetical protein n=1 Tax=Vibrio aphrogenes TaxID=1891186 RepID=UPI000B35F2AD|nr:hypothetical protein [Vibrio aphrogenes]
MIKLRTVLTVFSLSVVLAGCNGQKSASTGVACMGPDNDSLVEGLGKQCKAGDSIATKHPAHFCDFDFAIAYNDYNTAFCIYSGKQAEERTVLANAK